MPLAPFGWTAGPIPVTPAKVTIPSGDEELLVKLVDDLVYYEERGAKPFQLSLSFWMPRGAAPFPVVMWIHAGAWSVGDRHADVAVAQRFARDGIGFVSIDHRLSPSRWLYPVKTTGGTSPEGVARQGTTEGVRHPEHVKDCARAFAWLHRHVAEYGGNPQALFVAGHSSGGHLAALLALDPAYVAAQGLSLTAIAGAMPLDGTYDFVDYHAKISSLPAYGPAFADDHLSSVVGPTKVEWKEASPVSYLTKGAGPVPMLVLFERKASEGAFGNYADVFRKAVERAGSSRIRFLEVKDRDHATLGSAMANHGPDAGRQAMEDFIKQWARKP